MLLMREGAKNREGTLSLTCDSQPLFRGPSLWSEIQLAVSDSSKTGIPRTRASIQ